MNYQITITADDETVYTHSWENLSDNIVFGHTPKSASLSNEELDILSVVFHALSISFDLHQYVNVEDRPTETSTEPFDPPAYVEERMVQEAISQIFSSLENEQMFAGVEASA